MALPSQTRIDLARSIYGRAIAFGEDFATAAGVIAPRVAASPQDVRVALTYLSRGLATSEALEAWRTERPNFPLRAALFDEPRPNYQVGVRVVLLRQRPSGERTQVSVYLPMTWDQPISAIGMYVEQAHEGMNEQGSSATLVSWGIVGPTRAPAPQQL